VAPRKEINLSELKKALEESLEDETPEKKGVIQPGETIKL